MPTDIAADSISDYQMGELSRLKDWLHRQRSRIRLERERAQRQEKKEQEEAKRKAEQSVLLEF